MLLLLVSLFLDVSVVVLVETLEPLKGYVQRMMCFLAIFLLVIWLEELEHLWRLEDLEGLVSFG